MKVSILVTFYNQEQYVDTTLESIFSQHCEFEFDVLVGDDGSSDGTIEKVKSWQEKFPNRIHVYIMERELGKKYNSSQRASRNRINLLKKVKSEYFLFLDGDDYYIDKYKLQKQVEALENDKGKKYAMCAHNVNLYNEECQKTIKMNELERTVKLSPKRYWRKWYFHPDSIMFRSEYIQYLPYDIIEDYFNDNIITYCFLKFGGIIYLPDIMANYRITGNGMWTGSSKYIAILRNIMDMDIERKINSRFYGSILSRHFFDIKFLLGKTEIPSREKIEFYLSLITRDRLKWSEKWVAYSYSNHTCSFGLILQFFLAFAMRGMYWFTDRVIGVGEEKI